MGEQTKEDIELLKSCVRQPSHSDIVEAKDALYISARNKQVKNINDEHMGKIEGE